LKIFNVNEYISLYPYFQNKTYPTIATILLII
jgi:hypothetical protein